MHTNLSTWCFLSVVTLVLLQLVPCLSKPWFIFPIANHREITFQHELESPSSSPNRRYTRTPQTTPSVTTTSSTPKMFTGIAFPPQVFEVLTGQEPSTDSLGGRRNATTGKKPVRPSTTTTSTTRRPQVPSILSPGVRPPTRFPVGNRPAPASSRPQTEEMATIEFAPDMKIGEETPDRVPMVHHLNTGPTPDYSKYVEEVDSMKAVAQFLQRTAGGSGNYLVSPLSVGMTLAQMLMAAGPKGKSSIRSVLHLYVRPDPVQEESHELEYHKNLGALIHKLERHSDTRRRRLPQPSTSYSLESDTAVFVQRGLRVTSIYRHAIDSLYGSQLTSLDFSGDPIGSLTEVNRWADEATYGKIKQFLSEPPSPNTAAIFASSLYFKAPWETPFSEQFTRPGIFRVSPQENVTVPLMMGEVTEGAWYSDHKDLPCKALRLAYNETKDVAMYFFLPRNASMPVHELANRLLKSKKSSNLKPRTAGGDLPFSFNWQDPLPASWVAHKEVSVVPSAPTSTLSIRTEFQEENEESMWELDDVISSMRPKQVSILLPKVTLRGSLKLTPPGGGSKDHLVGMLEDRNQALGIMSSETVVHETILELSETGTEAAAISSGSSENSGGSGVFKADRPFLLLLRHELSGLPLFWGAVVRPTASLSNVINSGSRKPDQQG